MYGCVDTWYPAQVQDQPFHLHIYKHLNQQVFPSLYKELLYILILCCAVNFAAPIRVGRAGLRGIIYIIIYL